MKENVNQENLISIVSRSVSFQNPPKLFLEPVSVKQAEASTGTVEVATASAGVERIQGRKELEHKKSK